MWNSYKNKAKELKKVLKDCGQEPQAQELENAEKELQFKGKTSLTLHETFKIAALVWKDKVLSNHFN